jgi:KTSC domain-containing protein
VARSSLVERAIYDPMRQTLAITFSTGRTYLYVDVPASVYAELQGAASMGQYFNWRIRDQYEFRELE